jgi:hypothetical protein
MPPSTRSWHFCFSSPESPKVRKSRNVGPNTRCSRAKRLMFSRPYIYGINSRGRSYPKCLATRICDRADHHRMSALCDAPVSGVSQMGFWVIVTFQPRTCTHAKWFWRTSSGEAKPSPLMT